MGELPDQTSIGAVRLTVRDLERSIDFYERTLGLSAMDRDGGEAALGAGGRALVYLVGEPEASPRPARTTGLFHLAILVPSRVELARSLRRLVRGDWRLTGASDHLVSEALYLDDPDGIGIEVYRDRPREEWGWDGDRVRMATLPLDLDAILGAPGGEEEAEAVDAATRIGHVHLNVAELDESRRFYCDALGFDLMADSYPGALFVSAGGYHHHVGLNTWRGPGAPPPPAGAIGVVDYEVLLGDEIAARAAAQRLAAAGVEVEEGNGRAVATDPSGNRVALVA